MRAHGDLPPEAFAAAIAGLPEVGPARLHRLLSGSSPIAAWQAICDGEEGVVPGSPEREAGEGPRRGARAVTPALRERWRSSAHGLDLDALWTSYLEADITVLTVDHAEFPMPLRDDHQRPAVLFRQGRPSKVSPCVAIVGTRKCSSYGQTVASELGRLLTSAGVSVVSGLAHGIDAAAHAGAMAAHRTPPGAGSLDASRMTLRAPPIGVVGTGLDHPYPSRNAALWNEVRGVGTLLSEAPLGSGGAPWRFPARNRIIAALAQVVVVVESGFAGGSMHTVRQADVRNRALMAVPGPITSAASAGTNALIADGVAPCLGVDDVLVALGLDARPSADLDPASGADLEPDEAVGRVVTLLADGPLTYDQLAERLDLGVVAVMALVERSIAGGVAVDTGGMVSAVSHRMGFR